MKDNLYSAKKEPTAPEYFGKGGAFKRGLDEDQDAVQKKLADAEKNWTKKKKTANS